MVQDLEGQSKGYDMTSLQTVPYHIAGVGSCIVLLEEKIVSESDRLARHVGEGLLLCRTGL